MNPLGIELYLGRYQEALAHVEQVDCVITDPPYGERTHAGQRHGRRDPRHTKDGSEMLSNRGLSYTHWTPDDVRAFVEFWAPRTRGWFCALTSHDLAEAYEDYLADQHRYVFAPIPCVQHAMNVRLAGDGPSNWTTWLVRARPAYPEQWQSRLIVSRPHTMKRWGARQGAYHGPSHDVGENALDRSVRPVAGGKPLWLMRDIVRDYSRPNDLVCDPCAGRGTTLYAAALEGRRAVGAEMTPSTYKAAHLWLKHGNKALRSPQQEQLF